MEQKPVRSGHSSVSALTYFRQPVLGSETVDTVVGGTVGGSPVPRDCACNGSGPKRGRKLASPSINGICDTTYFTLASVAATAIT